MSFLPTVARGWLGRKGLGLKPGKPDPEDWDFQRMGLASSGLPAAESLNEYVPEVYNQLGTNSCVLQTTVMGIRVSLGFLGLSDFAGSRMHGYFNARAESGDEGYDLGSYLRNGPKAIQKHGMPLEKYWPFVPRRVNRRPSWLADRHAALWWDYQGYYRIFGSAEERLLAIRASIVAGKPVMGGWSVNKAFTLDQGPLIVGPPSGDIAGNHAMLITGFDTEDNFDVLSSWGDQWRDKGFVKMTAEYVLESADLFVLGIGG